MSSPEHAISTEGDERSRRLAELSFQPTGQRHGFLRGSAQSLRDVWSYRELLSLLVKRELKARYKDSTLGFLWSLLRPLAQLLIYYVALGKFLGAERAIPDYAIFVFTGLTAWALFSEIVAALKVVVPDVIAGDAQHGSYRPGDVRHSQADISKAKRVLGYEPTCDVRQGLRDAMPWYAARYARADTVLRTSNAAT